MRIVYLAIAFLICTKAQAQIIRSEPFYVAPEVAVSGNLLLDDYPGAAVAYSLRKLDKDYTGSAIRVRRSSDNTEQDIGFINNYLDTAAMKTFVGANDGFVVTWYNQADSAGVFGVRNATQTTAANQPKIVSSGIVILENLKPALDFDGSNDALIAAAVNQSQPTTFFTVARRDVTTGGKRNLFDGLISRQEAYISNNFPPVRNTIFSGVNLLGDSTPTTSQALQMTLFNSTSSAIYINGTLDIIGNSGTNSIQSLGIGRDTDASDHLDGKYQELILYASNQSSNRTAIESNINSFYSIY